MPPDLAEDPERKCSALSQVLKFIDLRTEVPGPKSKAISERLQAAVPRAAGSWAPVAVERAHGALLTDVDGNTFIDLTGGIGVQNVGHTHPLVVEAIRDQAEKFLHTDFTVVPYETYIRLAERLNALFPGGGPAKSIFFNSGAEAVENAVKIARVYTKRKAIIAFEGAFHGRTLMAMTLTSKPKPYKAGLGPMAPEVYRAPFPYSYRCPMGHGDAAHECSDGCFHEFEQVLKLQVSPDEVAAVIIEPVQGEGGFVVPPPSFLKYLRQVTEKYGILLICDEVQSGFGRTGTFFATEQFGIVPDLITVAKSIAAGLPLSGVIGKPEIMDAPQDSQIGGTYVGNPVACRAANAVLDIFEQEDVLARGRELGEKMRLRLEEMKKRVPLIGEVRGLGPMLAIELVRDRTTKEPAGEETTKALKAAMGKGVLTLKAGIYDNVVRFLPPLATPYEVIEEAMDILEEALLAVSH